VRSRGLRLGMSECVCLCVFCGVRGGTRQVNVFDVFGCAREPDQMIMLHYIVLYIIYCLIVYVLHHIVLSYIVALYHNTLSHIACMISYYVLLY
jgi:hypothetical protein